MSSDQFKDHSVTSLRARQSRLPDVGTTIFTVMSGLAQKHGAINLGQGFPDFDCDPALLGHVSEAMRSGFNQYPAMAGVLALREAVAAKLARLYGRVYNPDTEVTITAGATQAIFTAILAVVHPGDEVIVLDPSFDSYEPNIALAGGVGVHVHLTPGTFRPDFDLIRAALSPRTRAMIINTPHNPSATVWSAADMQRLAEILAPTNVIVISDEVYEHMAFDGHAHQSAARFPALAERSFIVSSFGKTFHVTGWKVGFVAAPAELMTEFRKVHQFNVFSVNAPMQHALAAYMADPAPALGLPDFYQRKRDLFREGLSGSRFKLLPCEGSYFQCVNYSAISDAAEESFARWLTEKAGVAAIPLSAFYQGGFEQRVVRFCFAKKDETLGVALQRLSTL